MFQAITCTTLTQTNLGSLSDDKGEIRSVPEIHKQLPIL